MAKRTWDEAVKNGLQAYCSYIEQNNVCYLYGAKGTYLDSEATIREFMRMEPGYFSRYSDAEKAQIVKNSIGKIAYDCSGFVGWCCTGDRQYSTGQINNSVLNESLAAGPAGSILYTTYGGRGRHIGLDIGYGYCLDMAYESTDANIQVHRAGVRLYRIKDGRVAWEKSGKSNVVDYTGSSNR